MPAQATVTSIRPGVSTAGLLPIAGMKPGWSFNPETREILHQARKDDAPLPVGVVPVVLGRITFRMANRMHTRVSLLLLDDEGHRRVVSMSALLDGTWADVLGQPRPVGPDMRHAFAEVMRGEMTAAPEMPAVPVKDKDGGILLPEADSQTIGYLRLGDPDEKAAMAAWRRVMTLAMASDRTTLAVAAWLGGVLASCCQGVNSAALNLYGTGQKGKSSAQKVGAALMGDNTEAGEIFGGMNTTGNAWFDLLQEIRYLTAGREEWSSSGMNLRQKQEFVSKTLVGGRRPRLGRDGERKIGVGIHHGLTVFSSNESLITPGQPESFASRLIELSQPFFPNGDAADEAVLLATQFHGWPLHWAKRMDLYGAAKVAQWRELHREITGRLSAADGGIERSLARIVATWVVGAHLLGVVLGMPEIGARAEEDARAEMPGIVGSSSANNVSPGALLWEKLAGLIGTEQRCWPDFRRLGSAPGEGEIPIGTMLGYWYEDPKAGLEIHVLKTTIDAIAAQGGIDTPHPALVEMRRLGVLYSTQGKDKLTSRVAGSEHLRKVVPGMVYRIRLDKARAAYNEALEDSGKLPAFAVPGDDSATARAEREAAARAAGLPPAMAAVVAAAQTARTEGTAASVASAVQAPAPVRVVFPTPERAVTEPRWDELADARLSAARIGVLSAKGLHLPNCAPLDVPVPGNVDEAYALAEAYDLRTLYVHQDVTEAMGLPAYDPMAHGAPMKPMEHPWAATAVGGAVARVEPAGVSCWMTAVPANASARRRNISVPAFDTRLWPSFAAAVDGEQLLDAVMLFTLSSRGKGKRPNPVPYYRKPNATAEDYARLTPELAACEAVRLQQIPQLVSGQRLKPIVNIAWQRRMEPLEATWAWVHKYDKTAAWLSAWSNTPLGVGEPVHYTAGCPFDAKKAGLWRVASVPGFGLPGLPNFQLRKADEGGWWVRSTPAMNLLHLAYPGWEPEVLEAWVWPDSRRVMEGGYERIRQGRLFLLGEIEAGRPAASLVKKLNGALYQSYRGYLEATEPRVDFETGEIYARQVYRPDWAAALQDAAIGNTWRDLHRFAGEGFHPLSLQTDAFTLASIEADPLLAKPTSMQIGGQRGGVWKVEGSAPMSAVLPLMADTKRERSAGEAVYVYTKGGK
ncbi:hypothetical protein ACIBCA_37050 [Kitasatospora sp. NPDC051170]|uniref:hypothetical protein n=1 Tax=Kitasatospora sp. NPDC051170 TaxID=3364056 RepID=UPI0037924EE4